MKKTLSLLAVLALAACGGAQAVAAASPTAHVARTAVVTINNFAFAPTTLRIRRGTVVVVRNRDRTNHTFSSRRDQFELPNLRPGSSGRVRFTRPGRYSYFCRFHPFMKGTIIVR